MLTVWLVITLAIIGLSLFAVLWAYLPTPWGAPWVPTAPATVRKMLQMAGVQPGQKVVDLGAGDGRIVIMAAREFKARAAGVEIDPLRCWLANARIAWLGLRAQARVYYGTIYSFGLADADVVTLYLLHPTNQALKERLSRQLRPGAKVVSHSFLMTGWTPSAIDDTRNIFMYEIGCTGDETPTRFV